MYRLKKNRNNQTHNIHVYVKIHFVFNANMICTHVRIVNLNHKHVDDQLVLYGAKRSISIYIYIHFGFMKIACPFFLSLSGP